MHVREWSHAKERLLGESQRKRQNQIEATNFEKSRGYVRRNFSSKGFNWRDNPLEVDTSSSSEDEVATTMRNGKNVDT
jgi:hypothetical protein